MQALCVLARLHHVAAEPEALAHALGLTASQPVSNDDLLRAAQHLDLKAKWSRSSIDRLTLAALPALAQLKDGRLVVLAQCDGQRVLFMDPASGVARPTIEPMEVFATQWTGELLLVTSRATLAGELRKFDFSWFVPALVKHRKLFGEALLVSLFLQLFALVSPLFFQVVMDKVLVHRGMCQWPLNTPHIGPFKFPQFDPSR
ncbi:cysteine peptidase family C39 domain-containing protein, partial [Inhella sp.]|uniref:cysteine peptidase family C39 domain-containing protein n=1 Tax=Inhella sp. TaxID=1921806 RepID=UPI00261512AF